MDSTWGIGPGSPYEDNKYLLESEDEGMDNLTLQLNEEEIQEGFKIDNDNLAEWAVCKISEDRADFQRLINVCETRILEYQEKIRKYQEQLDRKTSGLKGLLQQYFETVPHKATKTQETYKLPSGTLKKKYGTPEYIRDEDSLVKWLEERDEFSQQFIKTKKTVDWKEYKKNVLEYSIKDGKVITLDGEIVEGLTVQERPDSFEIEV